MGSGASCVAAGWLGRRANALAREPQEIRLQAEMRTIEIGGKPARVMGLQQPNGEQGISLSANDPFDVVLQNNLPVATAIHWHGLHPPNDQDGVRA